MFWNQQQQPLQLTAVAGQQPKKKWTSHPLFNLVIGLSVFMVMTEALFISFCLILLLNPERNPYWTTVAETGNVLQRISFDGLNIFITICLWGMIFLFLIFLALGGTFFKSFWPASKGFREIIGHIKWWDPFSLHYRLTSFTVALATIIGFLMTLVRLELVDLSSGWKLVFAVIPLSAVVLMYAFAKAIMSYTLRFVGTSEISAAVDEMVQMKTIAMKGETQLMITASQEAQIRDQARVYKPGDEGVKEIDTVVRLAASGHTGAQQVLTNWLKATGHTSPHALTNSVANGELALTRPFANTTAPWEITPTRGGSENIIARLLGS